MSERLSVGIVSCGESAQTRHIPALGDDRLGAGVRTVARDRGRTRPDRVDVHRRAAVARAAVICARPCTVLPARRGRFIRAGHRCRAPHRPPGPGRQLACGTAGVLRCALADGVDNGCAIVAYGAATVLSVTRGSAPKTSRRRRAVARTVGPTTTHHHFGPLFHPGSAAAGRRRARRLLLSIGR